MPNYFLVEFGVTLFGAAVHLRFFWLSSFSRLDGNACGHNCGPAVLTALLAKTACLRRGLFSADVHHLVSNVILPSLKILANTMYGSR